jgi:DNA polymerase I
VLEASNIKALEADLSNLQRFCIDNDVKISHSYKIGYFDVETDDSNKELVIGGSRLVSASFVGNDGSKVFLCHDDEKTLLKMICDEARKWDVVVTWNGDKFDVPFLLARFKMYGIDFNFYKETMHLDLMQLYIQQFRRMSLPSFKLDFISRHFLGNEEGGKIQRGLVITMFNEDRAALEKYNLRDCELLYKLEQKLDVIGSLISRCLLSGVFLNKATTHELLDMFVLRRAKNVRFPSRPEGFDPNFHYEGGYVVDPEVGLHENVIVLDFKCIDGNAIVPTKAGFKKAKDVIVGDIVFNDKGEFPVTAVHAVKKKEAVRIKVNSGDELILSRDHRLPLVDGTLKQGKDLKVGDRLVVNLQILPNTRLTKKQRDWCWLMGAWFAEGHMASGQRSTRFPRKSPHRITFTLGIQENRFASEILRCVKSVWKNSNGSLHSWSRVNRVRGDPRLRDRPEKGVRSIMINSKEFYGLFSNFRQFELQSALMTIAGASLFLQSFLEGDGGYVNRTKLVIACQCEAKKDRLFLVHRLLQSLGIQSRLHSYLSGRGNKAWKLAVPEVKKFEDIVGFYSKKRKFEPRCPQERGKIQKVKFLKGNFKMVDITVAGHPYFVANNILSHNSLYPSVIRTFNVSPEIIVDENDPCDKIKSPAGIYFKKGEMGIIPKIVDELVVERDKLKYLLPKMDKSSIEYKQVDATQYSLKTMANSFYGILGYQRSRYFLPKAAESITLSGQFAIKATKAYWENLGYKVIYGDTDSVFVEIRDLTDAQIEEKLVGLHEFLRKELQEKFNISKHWLVSEYEKRFVKFLLISKKRYFGLLAEGKVKEYGRGLELFKKDTLAYAKKLQKELLLKMVSPNTPTAQEAKDWILSQRSQFLRGTPAPAFSDLAIITKITKKLEEYLSITPHVRIAKHIQETNPSQYYQGMSIEYVVVDGSTKGKQIAGVPEDEFTGIYDAFYYWNKRIFPCLDRILEVVYPHVQWKQLYLKSKAEADRNQSLMSDYMEKNI